MNKYISLKTGKYQPKEVPTIKKKINKKKKDF